MISIAVLSALIALFSPFWGLIFIINFGYKYQNRKNVFYCVFAGAIIFLMIIGKFFDIVTLFDILIGVGISSAYYFRNIQKKYDYQKTILIISFVNIGYAIVRHLVFGKILLRNLNEVFQQYAELIKSNFQENSEQFFLALEITEKAKLLMINYYPAIWAITIIFAIYLTSIFFSKKAVKKWEHKKVRLPFFLVYILIAILIFVISPNTRNIGMNGLLMLTPLFLIQGISLLDFYTGNFFKKHRFFLIFFILSVVLNYYLIILLAFTGLLDTWFNFRKIEISEDLNESNLS
ncbi:MAG: DUF2232 domain-containing protein [Candidatus Cloacimonetes bacterium]|nr:DUF2232 domain-containing protein [Candidatus Cloacimonadota bacterium]